MPSLTGPALTRPSLTRKSLPRYVRILWLLGLWEPPPREEFVTPRQANPTSAG